MGFPLVPCGRSCLKRLDVGLFGFSLFGIVASIALADWIWRLKVQIADHLDLALPGEGQLWPDILGLAVIFVAPVHALELALRASIRNDFAYGIYARRRRTDNGKMLERLLFLHAVLSCLSGLLVMGACAGGSFFWSYSRRRMRQGLNRAMSRYNDDGTTKIRVDKLQLELRCCGDDSYLDWIFFSRRSDDAHYYDEDNDNEFADGDAELTRGLSTEEPIKSISIDLPFSCCSTESRRPCVHRNFNRNFNPKIIRESIWTDGCYDTLLRVGNETGERVVCCLILVSVYQLAVSIVSRLLQTARVNCARIDSNGERRETIFVGWIFGKRPRGDHDGFDRKKRKIQRLRKREHREDSGASSGAESIDGTCGNKETRRIDCAKENPRNSRRENYEVDRTKDRRKKANPNNCEDGKSKKATQNKIRGEYRDDLQNALEKSEDKIDRTTKIADNQELGNRRKLQSTEASFSSSTSSSSSLPPLPPTPGNLPNHGVKEAIVETDCPLHGRCPVHGTLRKLPPPGCCPVHGRV